MNELRGLTVRQPWAQLIANGVKRIDTRAWFTNYRGRVLVHAGRTESLVWPLGARSVLHDSPCTLGVTVAVATLVDCVRLDTLPLSPYVHGWAQQTTLVDTLDRSDAPPYYVGGLDERLWGFFEPEWYGWLLDDVKPVDAVQCSGRMGLWNVSPSVRAQLSL